MAFLDKFRKMLGGTSKPTVAQLERLIAEGERDVERAQARVDDLVASRVEAIAAGAGDDRRRLIAEARGALDDAVVVLGALRRRLNTVQAEEAEAGRQRIYNEALAQRDAAVARLRQEYPEVVGRLRDLAEQVRTADAAIEAANEQLPHGAVALDTVEGIARDRRAAAAEVLTEDRVVLWAPHVGAQPAPDQGGVRNGVRRIETAFGAIVNSLVEQRYIRRTIREGVPAETGPRLADLDLPDLTAPPAEVREVKVVYEPILDVQAPVLAAAE